MQRKDNKKTESLLLLEKEPAGFRLLSVQLQESTSHRIALIDSNCIEAPGGIEKVLSVAAAAIGEASIMAVVLLEEDASVISEQIIQLNSSPLPFLKISPLSALGYELTRQSLSTPIIIHTDGKGRILTASRDAHGGIRLPYNEHTDLLSILGDSTSASFSDFLAKMFTAVCTRPVAANDLACAGDNLTRIQREAVTAALARKLIPLAAMLYNLQNFIGPYFITLLSGFSRAVNIILKESLERAADQSKLRWKPNIVLANNSESIYHGAALAARAWCEAQGVVAEMHHSRSAWRLQTVVKINYPVVRPRNFVFDAEEDALPAMIDGRKCLFVVDQKVDQLYGEKIRHFISSRLDPAGYLVLRADENLKDMQRVKSILRSAVIHELPRNGVVIGLGGGIILDIAGFAASIFRRGVAYIRIPTTLVGLVDVGVSIKHGINYDHHKNIFGSFYPSEGTIHDARFLRSLPIQELRCGAAEIIKMGMISDERIFVTMEKFGRKLLDAAFSEPVDIAEQIINQCQFGLLQELQTNLFEKQLQRKADFGHTFSPLIEVRSRYAIPHGIAVGLDMILSTVIAHRLHYCGNLDLDRMLSLYRQLGMLVTQKVCSATDLFASLLEVKRHRGGKLHLPIPTAIGNITFIQELSVKDITAAMATLEDMSSDTGECHDK